MTPASVAAPTTWQRASTRAVELFHLYANWLVSITWKRFLGLALLFLISALILQEVPPFSYQIGYAGDDSSIVVTTPSPPATPKAPRVARAVVPPIRIDKDSSDSRDVTISIDRDGVRISPRKRGAAASASAAASGAAAAASAASAAAAASASERAARVVASASGAGVDGSIEIHLPAGADSEAVRDAVEEARQAIVEAIHESDEKTQEAAAEAEQAAKEARASDAKAIRTVRKLRARHLGDFLGGLAWFIILASAILKISYKSTVQAEVKAAVATENAESEQLKRQVVEARMAAMQAQVEPHFLFNTLASIDHLIETDPPRASQMQKNLIALLRASMPALREAPGASQTLGRELAMVRPYVEILKVRMEDRLVASVQIPEGLLSAEFPPMMIQSLVENAIKHGLEPKAEGGRLDVRAEIVDGKLVVAVADTGLGFGKAETRGTGTGLANIRERLQLIYGDRATMVVTDNSPSGTIVTLTVPYQAQPRAAVPEGSKA